MERIPEKEIMDEETAAAAFASADFTGVYTMYLQQTDKLFGKREFYRILDLGCGPGGFAVELAARFRQAEFLLVDASEAMLRLAKERTDRACINRIRFIKSRIQDTVHIPKEKYDLIVVCNTLHHFKEPDKLWAALTELAQEGTAVLVTDTVRPDSRKEAEAIVERVSGQESAAMKKDHLASLLASFTEREVKAQLAAFGRLQDLKVTAAGSHMLISGYMR